eukprot:g2271.t1
MLERRSNINATRSQQSSKKRRNMRQHVQKNTYYRRSSQNRDHGAKYLDYSDTLFCCFSSQDHIHNYGKSRKFSFDQQQLTNSFEPKEYKRGSPRRRKDPTFDLLCKAREIISSKYGDKCINNPMSFVTPSRELNILCNFFGVTARS